MEKNAFHLDSNRAINNKKKKAIEKLEEENLDLITENVD